MFILGTHGRRWYKKLFTYEESTNHAETPVASSMETVSGEFVVCILPVYALFAFVVKIFKEIMANRDLYLFIKVVCLL